jgi:hypothetical protein
MSIPDIQRNLLLEEVAKYYFLNGEKPTERDTLEDVSSFFSENPIGRPFAINSSNIRTGLPSDVDELNDNILRSVINMSVLYESLTQDMEKSMSLHSIASARLEQLRTRRDKIESDIDDYLLALNDVSGFFYSFSDYFSTLDYTDTELSTAFVDIETDSVSIPHMVEYSAPLSREIMSTAEVTMTVDGNSSNFTTDSPFESAVDGLSNTNWAISTVTDKISTVTVTVKIDIAAASENIEVSKIIIDPFTIKPMQIAIETEERISQGGIMRQRSPFGERVLSSANKMVFLDNARKVSSVFITMRKTEPDYVLQDVGANKNVYIFGAAHLEIAREFFDQSASFVSKAIALPEELANDHVIDSLALSANYNAPANTTTTFYVAKDVSSSSSINDFDWKQVAPVEESVDSSGSIINLGGTTSLVKYIRSNPSSNELELIGLDSTNTDLSKRNPSTVIANGANIYRIAKFKENYIPQTLNLEEGVNTVRILSVALDSSASSDLSFWADYVKGISSASEFYSRIDTGNGFLYGGDVGANGRSVYAETYIESTIDREVIIKEFRKSDINSQQWDVYVWLNGRNIGSLPAGTDTALLPWKFQEGLNHIAITANIPEATESYTTPYLGTLDIMVQDSLDNYGSVKLGTWSYVDFFHMKYNESDQPYTFTINDGEIISRRKPTANFRLKYTKPNDRDITAVRVRVDMERSNYNDSTSPSLKGYSLRFSYGDK